MKKVLGLVLALCLLAAGLVACDSKQEILIGSWASEDGNIVYTFSKKGEGYMTYMQIPLDFTYTFVDDVLTITYTEDLQETGTVMFYGDHEYIWDYDNKDGTTTQLVYARYSGTSS